MKKKEKKKRSKSKQNQKQHTKRCTIIVFDDLISIPFSPSSFSFYLLLMIQLTLAPFNTVLQTLKNIAIFHDLWSLPYLATLLLPFDYYPLCEQKQTSHSSVVTRLLSNVLNTAVLHPCPSSSALLGSPVLTLLQ